MYLLQGLGLSYYYSLVYSSQLWHYSRLTSVVNCDGTVIFPLCFIVLYKIRIKDSYFLPHATAWNCIKHLVIKLKSLSCYHFIQFQCMHNICLTESIKLDWDKYLWIMLNYTHNFGSLLILSDDRSYHNTCNCYVKEYHQHSYT